MCEYARLDEMPAGIVEIPAHLVGAAAVCWLRRWFMFESGWTRPPRMRFFAQVVTAEDLDAEPGHSRD